MISLVLFELLNFFQSCVTSTMSVEPLITVIKRGKI